MKNEIHKMPRKGHFCLKAHNQSDTTRRLLDVHGCTNVAMIGISKSDPPLQTRHLLLYKLGFGILRHSTACIPAGVLA